MIVQYVGLFKPYLAAYVNIQINDMPGIIDRSIQYVMALLIEADEIIVTSAIQTNKTENHFMGFSIIKLRKQYCKYTGNPAIASKVITI